MNDIEIAQAVSTILSKFTKATPDTVPAVTPATSEAGRVEGLDDIVAKALAQQQSGRAASAPSQVASAGTGAFETMDEAISAAVLAQVQYRHCSMQDRATFINGIRDVFLQEDVLRAISRMAVDETGMGNYEDKLIKNRVAALKTPGLEDLAPAR